jgi:hypothetical protein
MVFKFLVRSDSEQAWFRPPGGPGVTHCGSGMMICTAQPEAHWQAGPGPPARVLNRAAGAAAGEFIEVT